MSRCALSIERDNLSHAWAEAFLAVTTRGVTELVPLSVTVTGLIDGRPQEDSSIRQCLDDVLLRDDMQSHESVCESVAETIFPESMWNPGRDRSELFSRYLEIWPLLRGADPRNSHGTYFQRLIAFGSPGFGQINQLDHIIRAYRRGVRRRTALQATIFQPGVDHTFQPRRPFPCLDQVAFTPLNENGLHVTGFYAAQNVFDKAYGNYLGLCRLGRFMAHEFGLQLTGMTCVAAVALGVDSKRKYRALIEQVRASLAVQPEQSGRV